MKERSAALVWALALAACGAEAEIGNDLCLGDNLRCDTDNPEPASRVTGAPDVLVSPESLIKVRAASSLAPVGEDTLDAYELTADGAGTLWEFAVQVIDPGAEQVRGENRLRFRATALDGEVQQGSVEPPEKASRDAQAVQLRPVRRSERGQIVDLMWVSSTCVGDTGCAFREMLTFGSDPSMSPERSTWAQEELRDWSSFAMGRWLGVDSYTIEQRNSSHKLIWRQTVLDNVGFFCTGDIELLDAGELALLAVPYTDWKASAAIRELWRIGFDGNVKQRLALANELVRPRLARDTRNRALLAGGIAGGSIQVVRHELRGLTRTWDFLRTQYNELPILAVSVDLADTVYVLTATGGREEKDRLPVVCRVRADDRADCFVLEKPAEAMNRALQQLQATGPGIVYVGDKQRLFRYELPNE